MIKIKVGQIYKRVDDIFVITKIFYNGCSGEYMAYVVYNDGTSDDWSCKFISEYSKLIAEYPTWQEAVNSKEFKRE